MAMEQSLLQEGERVVLTVSMGDRTDQYPTHIERRDGNLIWIAIPQELGTPDVLPPEVTLGVGHTMDAYYQVRTRIVGRTLVPRPRAALEIVDAERVQQREYFRVELPPSWESAVLIDQDGKQTSLQLYLNDLSAGGFGARVRESDTRLATPKLGDEIVISPKLLAGSVPGDLRGRIVRVFSADDGFVQLGVAFHNLPPGAVDRIARFVLNMQRERTSRGLL